MTTERKHWGHPLASARLLKGAFMTLFADLQSDDLNFFNFFRINMTLFEELEARLMDSKAGIATVMRQGQFFSRGKEQP